MQNYRHTKYTTFVTVSICKANLFSSLWKCETSSPSIGQCLTQIFPLFSSPFPTATIQISFFPHVSTSDGSLFIWIVNFMSLSKSAACLADHLQCWIFHARFSASAVFNVRLTCLWPVTSAEYQTIFCTTLLLCLHWTNYITCVRNYQADCSPISSSSDVINGWWTITYQHWQ